MRSWSIKGNSRLIGQRCIVGSVVSACLHSWGLAGSGARERMCEESWQWWAQAAWRVLFWFNEASGHMATEADSGPPRIRFLSAEPSTPVEWGKSCVYQRTQHHTAPNSTTSLLQLPALTQTHTHTQAHTQIGPGDTSLLSRSHCHHSHQWTCQQSHSTPDIPAVVLSSSPHPWKLMLSCRIVCWSLCGIQPSPHRAISLFCLKACLPFFLLRCFLRDDSILSLREWLNDFHTYGWDSESGPLAYKK